MLYSMFCLMRRIIRKTIGELIRKKCHAVYDGCGHGIGNKRKNYSLPTIQVPYKSGLNVD